MLKDEYPELAKCWDYQRNSKDGVFFEKISSGSNRKVWWKCTNCGREWQTTVYSKAKSDKTTCRKCSIKSLNRSYVEPGVNDLASCNKKVLAEWNYEKNKGLKPDNIAVNSATKVWWICKKGHEWQAPVLSRTKEGYRGCPICSSKLIVPGVNDLLTLKPDLSKKWNYKKNGNLKPENFAACSNRKVWWICEKGHEWQATPNTCNSCPYCINQKIWPGYNDLATTNPELALEWNYGKNKNLKPEKLSAGSGISVWWKCNVCHYEWKTTVANRTKGHGCPVCKNRVVVCGVNDLRTKNPELAAEWNYEKNGNLKPENIIAGSPKVVWWKCKNGHEWKTSVVSRNKGHFCPFCDANKHTSISEKAFVYYLKYYGFDVEESKRIGRRELDIFIPQLNTGIEYDGQHYHRDIRKDLAKNHLCKAHGIRLIRIREPELPRLDGYSMDIYIDKLNSSGYGHLNQPIIIVLNLLAGKKAYDIDVDRDLGKIYDLFQTSAKKQSIVEEYPELLKEWDYSRNEISPEKLSKGAHYKAWWKCPTCGHEWRAPVYSRCQGYGCKKCGTQRISEKLSSVKDPSKSLAAKFPNIAKAWNYEKNGSLLPEHIAARSNKTVWWKCPECSREWQASVCNRVRYDIAVCPHCAGRKGSK